MGGLGFLFVIGIYIFIAYKMVKAAKSRWMKAVVLMAALLIPTADAIYGRIKLNQMCETEAGLKVNRVVEHVEGFMDETSFLEYWVKEQGYQFVEDRIMSKGLTTRYYRLPDGRIVREERVLPKSQYRLRHIYPDGKASYSRYGVQIEDIATGEALGAHTWVVFNGGWAERFLAMFSDAGGGNVARCSNSPDRLDGINRLVNSTLKH